ncbi:PP2C family protein-serine/threonine phosphatase [Methylophaga sp.]|uniref:PP2C family protein-serine/threonine phosphatase n=1 Tax=Methylophaga sp. TaxID=2024840 RepID=UPI003A94F36A
MHMTGQTKDNPTSTGCQVLVVEDSVAERLRLVAMLNNLDYCVTEASNGLEAMSKMQCSRYDIIISDWRMPLMTGFDFCKEVKKEPETAPYFILLTSQKTIQDLVAAMDAGADDFIAKPFAVEELRVRLSAGRRVIELRQSLADQNQEIQQTLARESSVLNQLRDDLAAAESLQRALLPDAMDLPAGVEILHYFRGTQGVAGDAYNIIKLSSTTLAFYLLDVSGHGVKAAMLSFYATQLLTNASRLSPERGTAPDPADVAHELNQRFLNEFDGSDYLTMVYGVLNLETGRGSLCQAGHPHPFILTQGSDDICTLGQGGYPVGMLPRATFESIPFEMKPGEGLVLSSDGIFTVCMKSGAEIQQRHLAGLLNLVSEVEPAQQQSKLSGVLDALLSKSELEDDISMLLIRRPLINHANQALPVVMEVSPL